MIYSERRKGQIYDRSVTGRRVYPDRIACVDLAVGVLEMIIAVHYSNGGKMPRYNVQHPETKEWRCFSSIVDDWITDWKPEEKYEKWRKRQYGINCGPVREANIMSLEEAERIIERRKEWEENGPDEE